MTDRESGLSVFLKGCNLNCTWCHNPESISDETERMYSHQGASDAEHAWQPAPKKQLP